MAVEFMTNYRNTTFVSQSEESAAAAAASGLQSVENLIRLFSDAGKPKPAAVTENTTDYAAVADAAVSKFRKVISLLGRTRTGHARFRRAPVTTSPASSSSSPNSGSTKIYCPTPIQQVPLPDYHQEAADLKTISFSCSPVLSRANSSLTGGDETECKHAPPQLAFQMIRNMSNSAGKPPLSSSSSFKRKCASSENAASGKCSGSSSRCQCSKRR